MAASDYEALSEELKHVQKKSEFIEAYDFEVYEIVETINLLATFRPLMFASIGLYLFGIYYGRKLMHSRPAFQLNTALFIWNAALSVFSIVAVLRTYPELIFLLSKPNGTYIAVCDRGTHNFATSFWALMFLFSKFVEFGDTAFIVLRKQKLIVLHWFHHVATLLICWFGYEYYDSVGRFVVVNAFVHSLMYPYYALRALKVKIPKKLSMTLTTVQILQMFYLMYVNYVAVAAMNQGLPCGRHWNFLYLVFAVIGSFALLFINFFVSTYYCSKKIKSQ